MATPSTPLSRRAAVAQYVIGTAALLDGIVAIAACLWRPDALAALTLVPPWCWLCGGVVTAPILWRLGQKRVAAGFVAFWVVFAIGWVEELPSLARLTAAMFTRTASESGESIRLVSLNCSGSERCVTDLQRTNPDIVLLQEAPGEEALGRMTLALFGEAGQFCRSRDVAILARGSVRELAADNRGTFVAARIKLPNAVSIDCISLRLAPPPSRLDFWTANFWSEHRQLRVEHRRQLAEILFALDDRQDTAAVVGGDFNTLPLDSALDQQRLRFRDSFDSSGVGWGATGTNHWPIFRVDQIWTNARVLPFRTAAETTVHSDHRMVVCDVRLAPHDPKK